MMFIWFYITLAGPVVESEGMHAVFQRKGNKRAKKGNIF